MPEYVELTAKTTVSPQLLLGELIKKSIQQSMQTTTKNTTAVKTDSKK